MATCDEKQSSKLLHGIIGLQEPLSEVGRYLFVVRRRWFYPVLSGVCGGGEGLCEKLDVGREEIIC